MKAVTPTVFWLLGESSSLYIYDTLGGTCKNGKTKALMPERAGFKFQLYHLLVV